MKYIAVCFSGDVRTFDYCYSNINNFLDGFRSDDITLVYFFHMWEKKGHEDIVNFFRPSTVKIDSYPDPTDFLKKTCIVNGESVQPSKKNIEGMKNSCYMFTGFKHVQNMILESSYKFDYIIRIRYDITMTVHKKRIYKFVKENKTGILLPRRAIYGIIDKYNCCDQFAIGDFNSMMIYFSALDKLDDYMLCVKSFHPETLLGYTLDCASLHLDMTETIDVDIIRENSDVYIKFKK